VTVYEKNENLIMELKNVYNAIVVNL